MLHDKAICLGCAFGKRTKVAPSTLCLHATFPFDQLGAVAMQGMWTLNLCMFDNFHFTFNFKSKVPHEIFKNKNECLSTSIFSSKMSPQYHMPSSLCQSTCGLFLHKSHYMWNSKLWLSIDMRFLYYYFLHLPIKCQKFANSLSKTHDDCIVDGRFAFCDIVFWLWIVCCTNGVMYKV